MPINNHELEFINGLNILKPILVANNFKWIAGKSGVGSGGTFSSGKFLKRFLSSSNRSLEISYRFNLGLVIYTIGKNKLSHEDYMRVAAENNRNEYPGFSEEPAEGFEHLANDLKNFAQDFLTGTGEKFFMAIEEAEKRNKLSGFAKLNN